MKTKQAYKVFWLKGVYMKKKKQFNKKSDSKPSEHTKAEVKPHKKTYSPWFISTIVLLFLLAFSFSANMSNSSSSPDSAEALTESQIEMQMSDFIENLVPPGVLVTVTGVSVEKGLYKVEVALESEGQEQEITSYVTQDGELFFTQALNVTQVTAEMAAQSAETEGLKSDKPVVDLFVMSFCPHGVTAEEVMNPVADLLGDTIDLNVRFIVSVGGDTPDSVGSLHGAPEAQENMRQACIADNYDTATFWAYLSDINADCYPIYRNAEAMETCWKAAAEKAGIDAEMVAACSNSTEAVDFMKSDSALASMYGVRGSPTLIINGAVSSAARTPDGYKEAICSAFTTAPDECGLDVQADGVEAASAGSC